MKYPVILLLPVLMLLDYFGTLVGAITIAGLFLSHSQWIRKARRTRPADAAETPER
jgi:hypothetical protein